MSKVSSFVSSCWIAYRRSITTRLVLMNLACFNTACTVLGISLYVAFTVIARQNHLRVPTEVILPLVLLSIFCALLSGMFWYGLSQVRDKL